MTLLDTIKSLLGMDGSDAGPERDAEPGVTVEREPEPDAGTERTVKGADDGEPAPPQSASSSEAETDAADTEPDAGEAETEDTASADEADEADDAEATEEPSDEGESPDVLEGIGPAYADRLSEAGVETVAQLADSDPAELAEETDVSETRLERWVQRAKDR